ncbi:MAG: STAS domain-containing protein [Candidatus Omnitrophica bacterium]|nr:STAS domain-containing protein [Candidatus Omnitrophota bacterium]MBU1128222.1 STAS domain-containing protein [Candidatus Omnitrophota bacterium]MBU1656627.1 STAS domain-containing protein [Candidatus Omnitrophota bacterium]MBU1784965.1 STAS domain-containing protein [Candidatus Omnitrophota bacterium]MBU1851806.1 STAS domain-containing protein [Candidatus Omnitrophota bacterium]
MQICMEDKDGIVVCRLRSDVDINSSPDVRNYFERLTRDKKEKILIDFKDVDYVDSSGLATFVEIFKNMRTYGGKLKLMNLSNKVRGLFEITKLDKLFEIAAQEADALSSF